MYNCPARPLRALPLLLLLGTLACSDGDAPATMTPPPPTTYTEVDYQDESLSDSVLYDKILGSLVGSAIGDAMGAPTEMWQQTDIDDEYGHIDSLTMLLREPSPEGPWQFNLPPGAGTDDTRWKDLMVAFAVSEHDHRRSHTALTFDARRFATYLNDRYVSRVGELKSTTGLDPAPLEDAMRRVTWLQEWALVSRGYLAGDVDAYRDALARFYGGEMSCAGMLYAPVLGAVYPGRPEAAYRAAYTLGLFDLGYARDITGLTAALTAAAFQPGADERTFTTVMREVDPAGYFRSRLLGRVAYQHFKQARSIVRSARRVTLEDVRKMELRIPSTYPYDSLTYGQTVRAYELLAATRQDVPFHAGEIHLINLTALLFSDFEFAPAMEFIVNYGRDNDTIAAVTGAILGALHGYTALPAEQSALVLRVNREVLDIDLEARARSLTDAVLARRSPPAT